MWSRFGSRSADAPSEHVSAALPLGPVLNYIVPDMKQIHGHEVLKMMMASGKSYTHESLVTEIKTRFGAEARFHTCSAEDLTAEQLVAFLDAKGKFLPQEGGFQTAPDRMCQH